jgi:hypothetical protein
MSELPDLNDQWRANGHPHAIPTTDAPGGGECVLFCPRCGKQPEIDPSVPRTLMAVMNEAIAHKQHCSG